MPGTSTLDDFAAAALDWPEVRALLERHAVSEIGRRALADVQPGSAETTRGRVARTRELLALPAGRGVPLRALADPRGVLERARDAQRSLEPAELAALRLFSTAWLEIAAWLRAEPMARPAWAALAREAPELGELARLLEDALDERGELVDSASPRLASARAAARELEGEIERAAKRLASSAELRAAIAEGHFGRVERRGGRPVLAVRAGRLHKVRGLVHDRSQSGETLFVEPEELVARGNQLASARADAAREEARLHAELTRAVRRHAPGLARAAELAGELELAWIGVLWSRTAGEAHSALAPGEPDAAGGLVLRAFRHPLLVEHERAGRIARAVPLDLRLGGDFDTLVITGPNTGGKTLALKSAGLAVLFARLGFPLACARGTTVPLYECVAADIGDGQEVQQNLSTFAAHLRRIAGGVARAGPRTLVLLDELGGGTDPDEGAALGEALLAWFAARGAHTLATTHLSRLKEFAFRHARAENAHAVFDLESLAPTYEIVVGAAGQSRALAVAARLGLPDEILAPARERLERRDAEVALLLGELERERLRTERRRREAEDELERTRGARAEAERAREEAQARQGTLANEAQRAIDEKLAGARAALAALERRLEQVPGAARAALAEAVGALARELAGASLSERRAAWLAGLRKGDLVWVPRLAKRLPLHRLDRARGEAVLRVGRAEMRVAVADISDVAVV